jgi:hypothetical protein
MNFSHLAVFVRWQSCIKIMNERMEKRQERAASARSWFETLGANT